MYLVVTSTTFTYAQSEIIENRLNQFYNASRHDIIMPIMEVSFMKPLNVGDAVQIHSYKHNKTLHRIWRSATVIKQTEDYLILGNYKTRVIEHDGRNWMTKEPAICYFFKDHWFNVIGMLKPDGIYYYCNLSSPYLYDEEAVKYIDYDLDVRVSRDGTYKMLDEDEYLKHQVKYRYSEDIKKIIDQELKILIQMIEDKVEPFNDEFINGCYDTFKTLKFTSKK